ncbi:MAG: glycosyltransferase family 4 protein [Alphaproteobacteria bacterium]|nr:glycosyltransferase family 4 protein [Alphaproteobacteria bacterium]
MTNTGPAILQVLPSLETGGGGVERSAIDVARALSIAGWRPIVASAGGAMKHQIDRAGAVHIELPLATKNPLSMYRNIGRLARVIAEHGVELVHARSRAPAWSARAAARRAGIPFVTTVHGTHDAGWIGKRLYNSVMASGDLVITNSGFTRNHLMGQQRIDPDKVRVIPRGIDLELFDPDRVSAERMIQLTQAWRLPDDQQVIMLPGRLTRWKGQGVLIDALAKLGRRDVRCVLVGSDQGRRRYRAELENKVTAAGLQGVVQFTDHCADMPAAYRLADVVVSASTDPEAFGRVAVEAQAMGRPIIATAHGGSKETILPQATAWLVPPGDADALAAALDEALALDKETREAAALEKQTYVRAVFSRDLMSQRTLEVYRELLQP